MDEEEEDEDEQRKNEAADKERVFKTSRLKTPSNSAPCLNRGGSGNKPPSCCTAALLRWHGGGACRKQPDNPRPWRGGGWRVGPKEAANAKTCAFALRSSHWVPTTWSPEQHPRTRFDLDGCNAARGKHINEEFWPLVQRPHLYRQSAFTIPSRGQRLDTQTLPDVHRTGRFVLGNWFEDDPVILFAVETQHSTAVYVGGEVAVADMKPHADISRHICLNNSQHSQSLCVNAAGNSPLRKEARHCKLEPLHRQRQTLPGVRRTQAVSCKKTW